jgi:integrase
MACSEGERRVATRKRRRVDDVYVYKRGTIWWTRIPSPTGGRKLRVSTGCTDQKAAIAKARDLERQAVDPTYRAAHETRLGRVIVDFIEDNENREIAEKTREFYVEKCSHLARGFGLLFPTDIDSKGVANPRLVAIDSSATAAYVKLRKAEGASQHSIHKELIALRQALELARHHGLFARVVDDVMPRKFSSKYEPRTGYLDEDDAPRLLDVLPDYRAAHVAFILATGARLSEAQRAEASDIDTRRGHIRIRGTKTRLAKRLVPIVSLSVPLLQRAIDGGNRTGRMFRTWDKGAMHRDLKAACLRAGIARWVDKDGVPIPNEIDGKKVGPKLRRKMFPGSKVVGSVSANDLRRSLATWLLLRGVDTYLISKVLGHVDTKMLERVYGQIDASGVGTLIEARLAAPIPVRALCAPRVPNGSETNSADSTVQHENTEES